MNYKMLMLCIIFGLAFLFLCMAFLGNKKTKPRYTEKKRSNGKRDVRGDRTAPLPHHQAKIDYTEIDTQLRDSKDRVYALPDDEDSSLQHTRVVLSQNTRASRRVGLTGEWLDVLNELIRSAYTIYQNADRPQFVPSASAYEYYKRLYYRSVAAGKLLEEAEKNVGNKVLALHQIRFGEISPEERREIMALQKELPQLQSLLSKAKSRIWNNTHKLKLLIKQCGPQGNEWYNTNEVNHIFKYGS